MTPFFVIGGMEPNGLILSIFLLIVIVNHLVDRSVVLETVPLSHIVYVGIFLVVVLVLKTIADLEYAKIPALDIEFVSNTKHNILVTVSTIVRIQYPAVLIEKLWEDKRGLILTYIG